MLGLAGYTLSKNRVVLQKPKLIRRAVISLAGGSPHGLKGLLIIYLAEKTSFYRHGHNTIDTKPVAMSAPWSADSCSGPVATMVTVMDVKRPPLEALT